MRPSIAFHHAVGLRSARRGQPMLDTVLGAGLIERVLARGLALTVCREAVGERLAVVGEDLLDLDRAGRDQARFTSTSDSEKGTRPRLGQSVSPAAPCPSRAPQRTAW